MKGQRKCYGPDSSEFAQVISEELQIFVQPCGSCAKAVSSHKTYLNMLLYGCSKAVKVPLCIPEKGTINHIFHVLACCCP